VAPEYETTRRLAGWIRIHFPVEVEHEPNRDRDEPGSDPDFVDPLGDRVDRCLRIIEHSAFDPKTIAVNPSHSPHQQGATNCTRQEGRKVTFQALRAPGQVAPAPSFRDHQEGGAKLGPGFP
jgi:hypothetical protein